MAEQTAPASERGLDHDPSLTEPLPRWYECGLVVLAAAVVSYGGFGLLLAVIGVYRFTAVALVGTFLTAGLSALAWPRPRPRAAATGRRRRRVDWTVTLPALAVVLVALGSMAWNGYHAGQHVAIGRDPGIYATTGKWIATRGNLEMHTGTEWTDKSAGVTTIFGGSYPEGPNESQFQFDHLTATLLAEGDGLGGDRLMFRVPAILGGLGLCAVYGAGCRILRRPWLVLAAVIGLAVSMPQINNSRDTLSETSLQILLWCGLALLPLAYERRHPRMAFLAGASLAGIIMSRIDAPVYLIPVPLLAALAWVAATDAAGRRNVARISGAVLLGAVPVTVLGLYDVERRAGHYYDDLHSQVHQLQEALGASAGLGLILLVVWLVRRGAVNRFVDGLRRRRAAIGWALGGVTTAVLLLAWFVRPLVSTVRSTPVGLIASLQVRQGLKADGGRTYAEHSMWWFSWYLGPAAVALFCLGAGLLVARFSRRTEPAGILAIAAAGLGTALYLWQPSIAPDQIWAMRRFVPAGLPTAMIAAAGAVAVLSGLVASRRRVGGLALAVVGSLALIIPPAVTTWPVRSFVPGPGDGSIDLAGVKVLCSDMGRRAAVLTAYGDFGGPEVVGALRAWCKVPVATMTTRFSAAQMDRLAAEWKAQGRTLWVIGADPSKVSAAAPGLHPTLLVTAYMPHELQLVIEKPPQKYGPVTASMYGTEAP